MSDDIENAIHITALKKAAIVMNALAMSMRDQHARDETKSLAWVISWAVDELEKRKEGGEA